LVLVIYYYIFKKRELDLSGGEIKKDFSPERKSQLILYLLRWNQRKLLLSKREKERWDSKSGEVFGSENKL